MRQKFKFVWHILFYNATRPLSFTKSQYNTDFQVTTPLNLPGNESRYREIVKVGKKQFGWLGIILANTALLIFCLPLSFCADLIIYKNQIYQVRFAVNTILTLIMINKFDMLRIRNRISYFKLLYLFIYLTASSYWTLVCTFLAAFENIAL